MNFESLLGYIVGFGSAVGLFIFQDWWKRRSRKKNLAKVLEVEIDYIKKTLPKRRDSTSKVLEWAERKSFGINLAFQKFDTHIYESLLGDLGIFKEETIKALRKFYSFLYGAEFWVKENQEAYRMIEGLTGEERKKKRELTRTLAKNHLKTIKEALENADNVISHLKKEYD